jgi:DNA-binding HxlR family transcriptional regulator
LELAQSIFDKTCFEILAKLFDNRAGLRFKDIGDGITVSDPVISNRLSLLKRHELIEVSPVIEEETENKYFVYRITKKGAEFAGRYEIKDLLTEVKKMDKRKRSK